MFTEATNQVRSRIILSKTSIQSERLLERRHVQGISALDLLFRLKPVGVIVSKMLEKDCETQKQKPTTSSTQESAQRESIYHSIGFTH